jgi:NADH-quinone oxidoreductase subunit L
MKRNQRARLAVKAFLTTRVGDAIMFAGMMLLYSWGKPPSLQFSDIFQPIENLEHLAHMTVVVPIFNIETTAIGLIAVLLLFWHDWQERAVPVARLVARCHGRSHTRQRDDSCCDDGFRWRFPARAHVPACMLCRLTKCRQAWRQFVTFIGAFTALFAATIAVAQWDIKRVLAYSTISQLGFMVAAIGIGAYTAALFHLITHAFFKGLLFLGSGSVIHGVEHGHHHAHEHDAHDARRACSG